MITADAPTLIASLGGLLSGFFWKTRKKTAIKTVVGGAVSAIILLVVSEYLAYTSTNNILGLIGGFILQSVGLFFYAWGTFNAGKWLGKEFNTP